MCPFPHGHPINHTPALWHPAPDCPRDGFAVVLFRRSFTVARRTTLWVTTSQRFELFLDGHRIARGPARSDPWRWNVSRVVIPAGQHVLAARVTHFGQFGGLGQMGGPGFFLVCTEPVVGAASTPRPDQVIAAEGWRCWHDQSRLGGHPSMWGKRGFTYDVGAGETVRGELVPWGWETPGFDDSAWPVAKVVCKESANPWGNLPLQHILQPDPLPAMEERVQRFPSFQPVSVPANTAQRVMLDMRELTNAYPVLTVSGGKGSRIQMVSAESPFTGEGFAKGHRDITDGKHIWGQCDEFLPDGGRQRRFTTLWFRAFRYLELTITTAAEPLTLDDVHALFTGYPMKPQARFSAYRQFWDVSWRTARLCAHETFFDCPHYEQMQFPGDTRVQAVFHYLIANDDRLARKAIDDFHASREPSGLLRCKWPSRANQILPTYALYWIGMLHDFRVYRGDRDFLRRYLPAANGVMEWFAQRVRRDGMLGRIDYAPFMDWTKPFACGNAPQDAAGGSAILTLLYAEACQWMAWLEPGNATRWRQQSRSLIHATLRQCWDAQRGSLADTSGRTSFSVHAQVEAILAGAWPATKARRVLETALCESEVSRGSGLLPATGPGNRGQKAAPTTTPTTAITPVGTFYYRYYVMQALKRAGLRDRFFELLAPWAKVLDGTGLTTWPEGGTDASRSDCHAWSVSPAIEFLQTILGVEPDPSADGFARITFNPTLGPLEKVAGKVPTPHGPITVRLQRGRRAELDSPVPVRGAGSGRSR